MRTAMEAKHVCEIPDELLPNLVLRLVADPVTLELRRINRSKIKHVRFSAGLRLEKAGVVRQRLKSLPANELRVALQRFGDRYSPSLNRTGGFPASGSRRRFAGLLHERAYTMWCDDLPCSWLARLPQFGS